MTSAASAKAGTGLLDELEWRGILHATTPGLPARLASGEPISGYIGFDPTAELAITQLEPQGVLVGIVHDISERKRLEEELRAPTEVTRQVGRGWLS